MMASIRSSTSSGVPATEKASIISDVTVPNASPKSPRSIASPIAAARSLSISCRSSTGGAAPEAMKATGWRARSRAASASSWTLTLA